MSRKRHQMGRQAWVKKSMFKGLAPVSGGFGMKMMKKMGWEEGCPLGRSGQGLVEPIEVEIKMNRRGLGSVDKSAPKAPAPSSALRLPRNYATKPFHGAPKAPAPSPALGLLGNNPGSHTAKLLHEFWSDDWSVPKAPAPSQALGLLGNPGSGAAKLLHGDWSAPKAPAPSPALGLLGNLGSDAVKVLHGDWSVPKAPAPSPALGLLGNPGSDAAKLLHEFWSDDWSAPKAPALSPALGLLGNPGSDAAKLLHGVPKAPAPSPALGLLGNLGRDAAKLLHGDWSVPKAPAPSPALGLLGNPGSDATKLLHGDWSVPKAPAPSPALGLLGNPGSDATKLLHGVPKAPAPSPALGLLENPGRDAAKLLHGLGSDDRSPTKAPALSPALGQHAKLLRGKHPVCVLQEVCAKKHWGVPSYELVCCASPKREKTFLYKVTIGIGSFQPTVSSPDKKQAKTKAALAALLILSHGLGSDDRSPPKAPVPSPARRQHTKMLRGKHPVCVLQEVCAKKHWGVPSYELVCCGGPKCEKTFLFKVTTGIGSFQPAVSSPNKKQAKTKAALAALQGLGLLGSGSQYII